MSYVPSCSSSKEALECIYPYHHPYPFIGCSSAKTAKMVDLLLLTLVWDAVQPLETDSISTLITTRKWFFHCILPNSCFKTYGHFNLISSSSFPNISPKSVLQDPNCGSLPVQPSEILLPLFCQQLQQRLGPQ